MPYGRDGKRFAQWKTNGCLTGFITLEPMLMFLYDRRSDEKPDRVLERSEPNERPVVVVIRHSLANALGGPRVPRP